MARWKFTSCSLKSPTHIFLVCCLSWRFHSFHLLAPSPPGPSDLFIQQVDGEGGRTRLQIRVLWVRAGGDQHRCCHIPLPTTRQAAGSSPIAREARKCGWVAVCPGGKGKWFWEQSIGPRIVSMMKTKLPLLTICGRKRELPWLMGIENVPR